MQVKCSNSNDLYEVVGREKDAFQVAINQGPKISNAVRHVFIKREYWDQMPKYYNSFTRLHYLTDDGLGIIESEDMTFPVIEQQPLDTTFHAVDLGLSVKWASANCGAKSVFDRGTWFDFSSFDYEHYDFATATIGSSWHTPSRAEWDELNSKCYLVEYGILNHGFPLDGYFYVESANGNYILLQDRRYAVGKGSNGKLVRIGYFNGRGQNSASYYQGSLRNFYESNGAEWDEDVDRYNSDFLIRPVCK